MSIRAYKIIEVKTKDQPSFNVGQEWDWIYGLSGYTTFNESNECRTLEFEVAEIKRLHAVEDDDHRKAVLNQILNDAQGAEFVSYDCY
jgi:hypothetical protein